MKSFEVEEIKEEAKRILDNFSRALERVSVKDTSAERKDSIGGFREEGIGEKCKGNFKNIMLKNAPMHDENSIFAEKKTW